MSMINILANLTMPFEHVSNESVYTLVGLVLVLLLSSLALGVKNGFKIDRQDELTARVITWWAIVVVLIIVIGASIGATIVFLGIVSLLALREYHALVPVRDGDHNALLWTYAAVPVQFFWVWIGWIGMFLVFIPVYMFIWMPTRLVMGGKTDGFVKAVGVIQWGLMTTVFSLSHAAMLLTMPVGAEPNVAPNWWSGSAMQNPGVSLLILLLLLTQLNDVAQYCWGKSLGKKKVLPTVSPGKTVMGLVGGVLTTVALAGLIGPWLTLLDLPRSLLIGLIVGVAGFAGDVCISAIKRDLGVKDSGTALPGHGGILDRLDSLTFTAPLYFHVVYFFYG